LVFQILKCEYFAHLWPVHVSVTCCLPTVWNSLLDWLRDPAVKSENTSLCRTLETSALEVSSFYVNLRAIYIYIYIYKHLHVLTSSRRRRRWMSCIYIPAQFCLQILNPIIYRNARWLIQKSGEKPAFLTEGAGLSSVSHERNVTPSPLFKTNSVIKMETH